MLLALRTATKMPGSINPSKLGEAKRAESDVSLRVLLRTERRGALAVLVAALENESS